jgi:1-deoxy-D-xylulose-5-phosphate reductoisomerase
MAAIVGAAGLLPTLAAVRSGKRVLLSNKESLVMSGELFMEAVADSGAQLLPIDSEHNAIFQCIAGCSKKIFDERVIDRIILTASGGPFRTLPIDQLQSVTPEQACAHPNWEMGRKISVDSASMMNKGLELIEACWLFDATPDQVDIVIHPQSIIHSMVQYVDGSTLAQLGNPDMRTPIAHALAWPERIVSGVPALDLVAIGQLEFSKPDLARYPALALAIAAARAGGGAGAVLNAANEVAVDAFLQRRLLFTEMVALLEQVLEQLVPLRVDSIEQVLEVDMRARQLANEWLRRRLK